MTEYFVLINKYFGPKKPCNDERHNPCREYFDVFLPFLQQESFNFKKSYHTSDAQVE